MNISAEVSQALGACPNLDAFAVDLRASPRPSPSDDPAAIQQRTAALRSIAISGISLQFEQWVLNALTLQTLSVEYDSPNDISLGWSVFAALSGSPTLRVSMRTHWPLQSTTT